MQKFVVKKSKSAPPAQQTNKPSNVPNVDNIVPNKSTMQTIQTPTMTTVVATPKKSSSPTTSSSSSSTGSQIKMSGYLKKKRNVSQWKMKNLFSEFSILFVRIPYVAAI